MIVMLKQGGERVQKHLKWILVVLLVLWCFVIWQFSLQPATTSSGASSQVQEFCNDVLESVGVDAELSENTVRKAAHFLEFFVLGVLSAACFFAYGFRHWQLLSPLVFVPVAAIDECIQVFVPGRGPHILDVLLDCFGGACGALAAAALILLILYIKNKKEKITKTP